MVVDNKQFDGLTRALGQGTTRRGTLGVLAGLTGLGLSEVAAKRRKRTRGRRAQAASADKVAVCHYDADADAYVELNVSRKGWENGHSKHKADFLRGTDGCCTDADCNGAGEACVISVDSGGNRSGSCVCTPNTCASQNKTCGSISNTCEGDPINCGLCPSPKVCSGGTCGGSCASACPDGCGMCLQLADGGTYCSDGVSGPCSPCTSNADCSSSDQRCILGWTYRGGGVLTASQICGQARPFGACVDPTNTSRCPAA